MYTFNFYYENGVSHSFKHITHVKYSVGGISHSVSGTEISTHCFPITETLHLFSETSNYSTSEKQLYLIEVKKEN